MAFLPGLFGGKNQVGFFGGGQFVPDKQNFELGQYGAMNARNAWGSQWAQDALDPNNANNPLAQQQAARGQQQQLADNLTGTLSGNQPSVANEQLKQTTQGNVANAYAMAQASGSPAAARMAQMNAANINQQAAGQGAQLRAQEIQNAQGTLGNVLGGMRGQDQGIYGSLNQAAQGYLQNQQNLNVAQQQGNENYSASMAGGFKGAQDNAFGGKMMTAASGVAAAMAHRMSSGGEVPGYAFGGDSLENDTTPAMLSPGEIVIPRSVTQSKDAAKKAALFVQAIKDKHARRAA